MCSGPVSGIVSLSKRSGTFSDGYDLYPALVSCRFQIDPVLAAPMRPFAKLKVTFLQVQLGYVVCRIRPAVPKRRRDK